MTRRNWGERNLLFMSNIWVNVFKNGVSKISRRQPLIENLFSKENYYTS